MTDDRKPLDKLTDPNATFTRDEVAQIVAHELESSEHRARIAAISNGITREYDAHVAEIEERRMEVRQRMQARRESKGGSNNGKDQG